jgi:probable phosphoglycerate mutase
LTPKGEEKAKALRPRLSGLHFDAVYSSPMQRARRTAELAGFADPVISPLLQEVNYGRFEGLTSQEIHGQDPDWELYKDGSPGGETPAGIYARAQRFIDLAAGRRHRRVLAFAHGHFLRAVGVAWIHADIKLGASLWLDVATLSTLRDGERGRVIALWNAP